MICPECKVTIPPRFSSCPMCGERLSIPPEDNVQPADHSSEEALSEEENAFVTPLFRFPPVTALLLVLNLIVFLLMERYGGSKNETILLIFGAKARSLVLHGELWRLLAANFIHIGWQHLLVNSITLLQLGMICENIYGRTRFIVLYALAGMGGFLASTLLAETISAGASSALAGLMGATLAFGWRHSDRIPRSFRRHFTWYLLPWVALMIGAGLIFGLIDNWAHLGGLFSGIVLGLLMGNRILDKKRRVRLSLPMYATFAAVCVFAASAVYHAQLHARYALDLLHAPPGERDYPGEIEIISRYLDEAPDSGLLYYLRADARYEAERYEAAEADYRKALSLGYDLPTVKNALAWLIVTQGNPDPARLNEALRLAREAVRKDRSPAYLNTLGWAYFQRGEYLAAIAQLEAAARRSDEAEKCLDLYMLSMAYFKKGDPTVARQKFSAARKEEQSLDLPDPDVDRFRQEADLLLGSPPPD